MTVGVKITLVRTNARYSSSSRTVILLPLTNVRNLWYLFTFEFVLGDDMQNTRKASKSGLEVLMSPEERKRYKEEIENCKLVRTSNLQDVP